MLTWWCFVVVYFLVLLALGGLVTAVTYVGGMLLGCFVFWLVWLAFLRRW